MSLNNVMPKSMDERREESRRKIMEAAMDLFYHQGYKDTTTRDIVKKAGILNGSLYNRFKSKEDILLNIISDAMVDFLSEAEKLISEDKDPMIAFAFPVAVELYLASLSRRMAELIYDAHCSWAAVNEYVNLYSDWMRKFLSPYHQNIMDDEKGKMKVIAIIGAVGNVCGCYANGIREEHRKVLAQMIKMVSAAIGLPVFDVNALVSRISYVLESGDMVICGYRISPDTLPDDREGAPSDKD